MERRRQSFQPLKSLADQMSAALDADDPARQQLQHMSDWASLLMQHYDTLSATWQAQQAASASGASTSTSPDEK